MSRILRGSHHSIQRFIFTGSRAYRKISINAHSLCRPSAISLTHTKCMSRQPRYAHSFHTTLPRCSDKIVPFNLADIGEGIAEVEVLQWYVREGDTVKQFDKLCEVQSDKAAVDISSRFDGIVHKIHHPVHGIAKVGRPLVDILLHRDPIDTRHEAGHMTSNTHSPTKVPTPAVDTDTDVPFPSHSPASAVLATPAVRRLARENGIDLSTLTGSGRDARITKEDLLNRLSQSSPQKPNEAKENEENEETVVVQSTAPMDYHIVPLHGYQRTMFKTMTQAMAVPHVGLDEDVCLDALRLVRQSANEQLARTQSESPLKLSFMPFFIKSLSLALQQHPQLNSHLITSDTVTREPEWRVFPHHHHIGVAMATPKGLAVPVLRHCESKSVLEIARELHALQHQTQFSARDMQPGTITLSNIGAIGGTSARPLLVTPQTCIGALGQIQRLPRFISNDSDEIVAQHILRISWSADHRVIDGATLARFSSTWKHALEHPHLWCLDLK